MPLLTRIRISLLVLLMLGANFGAMASSMDEASKSFKSGQYAKALDQVDDFLSDKPKDPQGRFLKGIILTNLNKTNEAIAVFRKLTEDYPELPEPYNNLAVIYAQLKQYDKAREYLEKAIRTNPAYATAHENLGDIYTRLASNAYGKALQIDASNGSAQTKLAMINELVGGAKVGAGATAAPVKPFVPIVVAKAENKPVEPPPAPKSEPLKQEPPKPEPKPAAAPPAPKAETSRAAETEIIAAVDNWLAAWSKKDVKSYLAHYSANFQVPGGGSRKSWEKERESRIGKPGKIEVSRDKVSIKFDGEDKATVHFRQNYRSATFKSSSGKSIVLIREGGKWRIQQEQVG